MSNDAAPRLHFFYVTVVGNSNGRTSYDDFIFSQYARHIRKATLNRLCAESGLDRAVLFSLIHLGHMTHSEFNQQ